MRKTNFAFGWAKFDKTIFTNYFVKLIVKLLELIKI